MRGLEFNPSVSNLLASGAGESDDGSNPLVAAWKRYEQLLDEKPLLMKALALAVAEFPLLNCRLNPAADTIHYQAACHIGMAVDSASGLLVPNVKDVQSKSSAQVRHAIAVVAAQKEKQRAHQLSAGDCVAVEVQRGSVKKSVTVEVGAVGVPMDTVRALRSGAEDAEGAEDDVVAEASARRGRSAREVLL